MSYDAQRQAIEERFHDNWTATPLSKVAWDNVAFAPPPNDEWVRLSIVGGDSNRMTIGSSLHRSVGIIYVSCFVPVAKGSARAFALADAAAAIFRDAEFNGILCRSPA